MLQRPWGPSLIVQRPLEARLQPCPVQMHSVHGTLYSKTRVLLAPIQPWPKHSCCELQTLKWVHYTVLGPAVTFSNNLSLMGESGSIQNNLARLRHQLGHAAGSVLAHLSTKLRSLTYSTNGIVWTKSLCTRYLPRARCGVRRALALALPHVEGCDT